MTLQAQQQRAFARADKGYANSLVEMDFLFCNQPRTHDLELIRENGDRSKIGVHAYCVGSFGKFALCPRMKLAMVEPGTSGGLEDCGE